MEAGKNNLVAATVSQQCLFWAPLTIMVVLWWAFQFKGSDIGIAAAEWNYFRAISYGYIHLDYEHLIKDSIYFLAVCFIAQRFLGGVGILSIWHISSVFGAFFFCSYPNGFDSAVGSSSGTHGLLACLCLRVALESHSRWFWGTASWVVLLYLLAKCFYALFEGHMPWPNGDIENAGTDHLGGVLSGIYMATGSRERFRHSSGSAIVAFCYFLILILSDYILNTLPGLRRDAVTHAMLYAMGLVVVAAVFTKWLKFIVHAKRDASIFCGIAAFYAIVVLACVYLNGRRNSVGPWFSGYFLYIYILISAISQEFLFRLFPSKIYKSTPRIPVIVLLSTLFYSSMHFLEGWMNIALLFCGIILYELYCWSGNFWHIAFAHAIGLATIFFLGYGMSVYMQ